MVVGCDVSGSDVVRTPAAGVPVDSINTYASEVRVLEAKVLAEQQAVLQVRLLHVLGPHTRRNAEFVCATYDMRYAVLVVCFASPKRCCS